MRLWRIAQPKVALDKQCAGSARYGGRWNPIGMPALYCGTTIALCSLEQLVHAGAGIRPPLVLVAGDIPDAATLYVPDDAVLPEGWNAMPGSDAAQEFGRTWLEQGPALGMQVPSVIVPEESNVILNPRHPDYARVELRIMRPFTFDERMWIAHP